LAKSSWQKVFTGNKSNIMAGSFRDLTVYKKAFDLALIANCTLPIAN
jgi:hypothetical protein